MHYVYHITACSQYTWNGTTYTQSGTYLYNYICGNGCPSVDTLYLIINQPMHYVYHITACSQYTWNGTTYTQSGTYLYNYICGNGCPSVDTLYLVINQPMHYVYHITACSQYTWNGTTYTQSGTYLYNYICGNGCPSVDTLYLTISQPMHNVYHITSCGQYTWNGSTYTQSGTYLYNYVCGNSCPSVDTLYLIINAGTHNSLCQIGCGPFTWNGKTYCQSGTYVYTYTNSTGCASADTLHLTISNNTLVMGSCSETNPPCGSGWCGQGTGSVSAGKIISSNGTVTYVWKNSCGKVVGTCATVTGLAPGTYYLTASDKCSTVTCCATIVEPVTPWVYISAGSCSNSCGWGSSNTLYVGQNITLNAEAYGGSQFTYQWTGSGLSCSNCASPVFTATQAGTFTLTVTVTNCTGCTATGSITICVINCGGNGGGCGWGNGGNCGGNNGGGCGGGGNNGGGCSGGHDYKTTDQDASTVIDNVFDIKVYPNPFNSQFHVSVNSSAAEDVYVKVFDITGQIVYEKTVSPVSDNMLQSDMLQSGVYFVQVIQGGQVQLFRVVKQQ
jgi:hypothetical protein